MKVSKKLLKVDTTKKFNIHTIIMSKFVAVSLFVLVCIFAFSNASFQARFLQPRMNEVIHKCHHTAGELTLKLCMKVIIND